MTHVEIMRAGRFVLTRPDDWHLHLRDGAAMQSVVGFSAAQFGRAIVMPNLKPPVTTTVLALAYRQRILAALPVGAAFEPLMTLYLTENTSPEEIVHARNAGVVALKYYPAGATTNSQDGVTDIQKVYPVLEAMQREGLVLCIHGEVTNPAVDVFDREARFIEDVLIPLRRDFPELKLVLEHITTAEGAGYVLGANDPFTAATVTPQHLLYSRNALFTGGLQPHFYYLPVLKSEHHRLALVRAVTSGSDRFFLGTDSAPHAAHLKEHAGGHAGCFTAPAALELYAEAFEAADALHQLEAFASWNGPDFYGLPRSQDIVTLKRESWTLPETLPFGDATIKPLRGGQTLEWKLVN